MTLKTYNIYKGIYHNVIHIMCKLNGLLSKIFHKTPFSLTFSAAILNISMSLMSKMWSILKNTWYHFFRKTKTVLPKHTVNLHSHKVIFVGGNKISFFISNYKLVFMIIFRKKIPFLLSVIQGSENYLKKSCLDWSYPIINKLKRRLEHHFWKLL